MSDSSDEDWPNEWIPYSERIDWSDITPLPQDDGDFPIVAIAYTPKFREVFDYFRAILAKNEKSARALELTMDALRLNPANYTVWQYRRDILKELNSNLYDELDYVAEIITENAKNYQVWHHRKAIVELLNDGSKELDLTERALRIDAKNYHAWQHRQWVIKTFDLYSDELMFVDRLIGEDIRNNSAWNQRFFIVKYQGFTPEIIEREIQYCLNRIRIVKNNESVWNYLRGVLYESPNRRLSDHPVVIDFCEDLYNAGCRSPYLLAFLIDLYSEQCLTATTPEAQEELSQKVYTLCDDMSQKHDIIRRKYWQYIAEQLKNNLEGN